MSGWSEAEKEFLRTGYRQGRSVNQIAYLLGNRTRTLSPAKRNGWA